MRFLALSALIVLVPAIQVFAAGSAPSVPEPLSMTLLGIGLAGLGAAELIRRRKDK